MKIAVIGAGGWGTALAKVLAGKGYSVTIWVRRQELLQVIRETKENSDYLPGVKLPPQVYPCGDLEEALKDKEILVIAVPSHTVRGTVASIRDCIAPGTVVVNAAKGIEENSLMRLSQVVVESLPENFSENVAVLSGPNHAEEVSRFLPTATVIASPRQDIAEKLQDIFMTDYLRVYTNPDVIGVELGGALKNVIAIGAGVCDGLEYGDNTKAALLTRGLVEITRLGTAMGAHSRTFSGLTGVGDLFVTCASSHSRNRYVGKMLGSGEPLDKIVSSMKMVAEGIKTTRAAYRLAQKHGVEMPITRSVYSILFEGVKPLEAVKKLMKREKTHEIEEIAFNCWC